MSSFLILLGLTVGIQPAAAQRAEATTLTARFVDGVVLVQGELRGTSGWWILDTGFDYSLIDAGFAEAHGLSTGAAATAPQPGGEVEMRWTRGMTLQLQPGAAFATDSAAVIDLSGLAPAVGTATLGLLGHDFFLGEVVQIDYAGRAVRLLTPGWRPRSRTAIGVPLWLEAGEPFALGYLWMGDRTVPAKLKIDTGSFTGLGLNGSFVAQTSLIPGDLPLLSLTGLAVGGGVRHLAARLDSMRLGETTIPRPVASWSESPERVGDAGTLGAAILSRFVVTFDYANRTMWLEPTPGATAPEVWDAAGMLIVRPPDGPTIIAQVIPASPAEESGLREGDRILEIGGRDVASLSLEEVRRCFRQPGRIDTLRIERADEPEPLPVVLRQRELP